MDHLQDVLDARADRLVADHRALLTKLVALRVQHRISQEELAEAMGVSQPTVSAFERYDANPTLSTIRRYAMAVGAVLDTEVVDDCSECVPSSWSAPLHRRAQFPVKPPPPPSDSIFWLPLALAGSEALPFPLMFARASE